MVALAALASLAWPGAAAACSWCVASASGDRSLNWPSLSLIAAPFIVGVVIAVTLARSAGVAILALRGHPRPAGAASGAPDPIKETT